MTQIDSSEPVYHCLSKMVSLSFWSRRCHSRLRSQSQGMKIGPTKYPAKRSLLVRCCCLPVQLKICSSLCNHDVRTRTANSEPLERLALSAGKEDCIWYVHDAFCVLSEQSSQRSSVTRSMHGCFTWREGPDVDRKSTRL